MIRTLALALALAPVAAGAALLEDRPGSALVHAGPGARLYADAGAEARHGPFGRDLGNWSAVPPDGEALGEGGCDGALCGLHVVEVRGGEARVVEGRSGVLVRPDATSVPAREDGPEPAGPAPPATTVRVPVPGPATAAALGALAVASALARRFQ